MLATEKTIENVNRIVQRMFIHNRTWDRALAYTNVEWALKKFNDVFHSGLAHLFPLAADLVGDILLRYNIPVKYYETPTDERDYSSLTKMCGILPLL